MRIEKSILTRLHTLKPEGSYKPPLDGIINQLIDSYFDVNKALVEELGMSPDLSIEAAKKMSVLVIKEFKRLNPNFDKDSSFIEKAKVATQVSYEVGKKYRDEIMKRRAEREQASRERWEREKALKEVSRSLP